MEFVNLKVHTDYTLLEGVSKIEEYIEVVKKNNLKYLSITDTNIQSAIKAYRLCEKEGINFVLGLELYTYGLEIEGEYAISAFAKGINGYKELIKISNITNSKFNNGRKIIDINEIVKCENLVVIAGGINSEIYKCIKELEYTKAHKIIEFYNSKFKDFYIEIPAFSMENNNILEEYLNIINKKNVKYVLTNDTYYANKKDFYLQKIVSAIRENVNINKIAKYYKTKDLYFKTINDIDVKIEKEILDIAIKNTEKIAKECIFEPTFRHSKLPEFSDAKENLKNICEKAINLKYGDNNNINAIKRLAYELEIIDKMNFNSYFLLVYDIVKFAKENNIIVGPGRGSAASSIVSYLLGITNVDPIKYDLMFERFLNIGRKSMPDIDIDFEPTRRSEVIKYIITKYGEDKVCNIITLSRLKEKQLRKDLGRIKYKGDYSSVKSLINNIRHSSIHASGLIISKEKLEEFVPLKYENTENIYTSQYTMEDLEYLSYLKLDVLALTNLELFKYVKIDFENIELENKEVFDLYNKGLTLGIFQVESEGITELIKKFKINKFIDLAMLIALYRPGPLKSGMVESIIKTKNNNEQITYEIEELKDILDDTYGSIIYQEQIMKIVQVIAGFNLNEADDLRKAISKKNQSILVKYKERFINHAVNRSYDKEKIEKLYHQIENFGQYGFNKAHTIPYAKLSYYTAYVKKYYNKKFYCYLLNENINSKDKLLEIINEMKYFNIKLLNVDYNKSKTYFSIEGDNIRMGFYAIKDISINLSKDIEKEKEKYKFNNYFDFISRMHEYGITKEQILSLNKTGIFSTEISRKELNENIDEIYKKSKSMYLNRFNLGANSGLFSEIDNEYKLKNEKEYGKYKILELEYESLNYPISLQKYNIYLTKEMKMDKQNLENNVNAKIYIKIDDLNDEVKEKLKLNILLNKGNARVYFTKASKILNKSSKLKYSIDFIRLKDLIELVGDKNILINL